MTLVQRIITGLSDGTVATTGNTGASNLSQGAPGSVTFATSKGAHGQTGLKLLTTATSQTNTVRFALNAANATMQFTGKFTSPLANPSASTTLIAFRHSGGRCFSVIWGSSGNLVVSDTVSTNTQSHAAGVLAFNTQYVMTVQTTGASTTAGNIVFKVYTTAGVQVGSTLTITNANLTVNNFSHVELGGTDAAREIGWVDLQFNDGAGSEIPDYSPSAAHALASTTVVTSATVGTINAVHPLASTTAASTATVAAINAVHPLGSSTAIVSGATSGINVVHPLESVTTATSTTASAIAAVHPLVSVTSVVSTTPPVSFGAQVVTLSSVTAAVSGGTSAIGLNVSVSSVTSTVSGGASAIAANVGIESVSTVISDGESVLTLNLPLGSVTAVTSTTPAVALTRIPAGPRRDITVTGMLGPLRWGASITDRNKTGTIYRRYGGSL